MKNTSWKSITLAYTVKDCGAYFTASLDGETFVVTASAAEWPTAAVRLAAIALVSRSNMRKHVTALEGESNE